MTTLPLASWLGCSWRHEGKTSAYATVLSAAIKLEQVVWDRSKEAYDGEPIKLLLCDDADLFRLRVEEATEKLKAEWEWTYANDAYCDHLRPIPDGYLPLLGTHTDPSCRALSRDNFFALIGTRTDRPLPLFSTNTACAYPRAPVGSSIEGLFQTRLLWSDFPARDCGNLEAITSFDHDEGCPAVHIGTAWVRDDRRGKGIAGDIVRLHRMTAYLRWGLPLFATVDEKKNHGKGLRTDLGVCIGRVIEKRGDAEASTRVTLYTPESVIADSERVLSDTPRSHKTAP